MTGKDVMRPVMDLAGEKEVNSNNNTTITRFFGMVGKPYCGMTVKFGFKKAGCDLIDACSNPFYVPTIRQFMQDRGWRIRNEDAQAGDIICVGPNQHVCFCFDEYSGTTKITLEGNATVYKTAAEARASGAGTGAFEGIGYKKRVLNANCHVFRPPYDGGSGSTNGRASTAHIADFQMWLNEQYASSLNVDGSFGRLTRTAAVKALQAYLNKTYKVGLEVDGDFGPLTKKVMQEKKVCVKKGDTGDLVYILQGMLYCRSYDPNGIDGEFGGGTDTALRSYQGDKGLVKDGEAGAETFSRMMAA